MSIIEQNIVASEIVAGDDLPVVSTVEQVSFEQTSFFSRGACTLCSTKLWRFKKKYQCNSCKKITCGKCSAVESTQSVRVCMTCATSEEMRTNAKKGFLSKRYGAVKKAMPKPAIPGKLPGFGGEKLREMEGVADYQRTLPAWMFLLKPFHEEGKNLAIGALAVKVQEAKNLPAMDRFGTSDPFCEVYLTQPNGENYKQKTKTQFKTLTPQFNTNFSFQVTTTLCSLHVNIYDFDASGSNDLIGSVEIPLGELTEGGKLKEDWFTLKLSDEAKAKVMKNAVKQGKKNQNKKLEAPQVKLTLMYDFSKLGELASHFTDNTNPNIEEPKFDMDVLYSTGMKLMELTQPMVDTLGEIDPILRWTNPMKSLTVLIVFMLAASSPWTIPVMVELWLIRYMFWQYVVMQWKSESLTPKSEISDMIDSDEAKKELKKMKAKKKADREGQMNGVLASMATNSVSGAGMSETLQWVQNLLVYICETLEYVLGLFRWADVAVSKVIVGSLCAAVLYSCLLPFNVLILVGGSYVICMQTVPGQLLFWFAMSTITYVTRAQPVEKKVETKTENVKDTKKVNEPVFEARIKEIVDELEEKC